MSDDALFKSKPVYLSEKDQSDQDSLTKLPHHRANSINKSNISEDYGIYVRKDPYAEQTSQPTR